MIIGVCGFGFTGSGAVVDMLKEYEETQVLDSLEFSLVYKPDGVEDLYRNIVSQPSRFFSSDSSIRRFKRMIRCLRKRYNHMTKGAFEKLSEEYIASLIQVEWLGSTGVHYYQDSGIEFLLFQKLARAFRSRYEKYFGAIHRPCLPDKKMYYSCMSDTEFCRITKAYISALLEAAKKNNSEVIVLDQPFAANNPEKSFLFFESPKAIVVKRDPRDLYLLAKMNLGMSGKFIPTDKVDNFVNYYRGNMENCKYNNCDDILEIDFEELVYNYEEIRTKIEQFLGISLTRKDVKRFFNPEVSINNTQLFKKYSKYDKEIKVISSELSEYLFDFDKYDVKPQFLTKSF